MKAKFNKAALQEALTLVSSIVPVRTPKPILQCLRIMAKEGMVDICATDLEVGIKYSVAQVEVDRDGDVVVPADKITSIVRESADEIIEIEVSEAMMHIRGADSHFTIYGYESGQYPEVPGFDGGADIKIGLAKLQTGAELTVFAVARENTRYALNGILWEVQGKRLTLVATDGRRLAKAVIGLAASADVKLAEKRIIVPAKTMALLNRIGGEGTETTEVQFMDNQIVLAVGAVIISSSLVEGNFPKYEDIIPRDYDKKIMLSTDAALSAVRRAALLATEDSKGIRLALDKGTLVFSSRAPEAGDARIDMAVDYGGASIEIGFNPQFLIDVLRVIRTDEFELNLGGPDRPGMIKTNGDFVYIVMPVNL
jgi:DNA polymerase-3 subunit beta